MEITDDMKKWLNNMDIASKMRTLNPTTYERQIANLVSSGKINEEQADYMQEYLNRLRR